MTVPVERSRKFFLLKDRFKTGLSGLEKSVFSSGTDIDELENLIRQMKKLAENSPYFERKIEKLTGEFARLIAAKKYNQADFNRLFRLADHLEEDEKARFLNDSLRAKIEKISRSMARRYELVREGNIYSTFTFRDVHFITDAKLVKMVNNPSRDLRELTINGQKTAIFPSVNFGLVDNDEEHFPGNILVAKKGSDYKCYRFDELGPQFVYKEHNFKKKLKPLADKPSGIEGFLKRKETRFYYLA